VSVKSFLQGNPVLSGFVLRRIVAVTAAVGVTLLAPSMTNLFPPSDVPLVLGSSPSATETGFPEPSLDPNYDANLDPGMPTDLPLPTTSFGPTDVGQPGGPIATGMPTSPPMPTGIPTSLPQPPSIQDPPPVPVTQPKQPISQPKPPATKPDTKPATKPKPTTTAPRPPKPAPAPTNAPAPTGLAPWPDAPTTAPVPTGLPPWPLSAETTIKPQALTPGGTLSVGCTASYTVVSASWGSGFVGSVKVTAGSSGTQRWSVPLNLPVGTAITGLWNGSQSGNTVSDAGWNGKLTAGQSTEFMFLGTGSANDVTVGGCIA
jgi:cellulase/cellobiase CelA1